MLDGILNGPHQINDVKQFHQDIPRTFPLQYLQDCQHAMRRYQLNQHFRALDYNIDLRTIVSVNVPL